MRNLKRALSLGLTAAMISGLMVMGSSAAGYADVTSEDNQEAIEVLQAIGVMVGDENGDFNPDALVTRNEMAVVMSNLMEYNVATYANTSPFTDVPSWAEPYVAACWTNGITAGYTDTTYGGSDNVTTAQAALMLMKALGYFQYSSDFGSDWQLSTVTQGNRISLFDDVDSGVREAMTRNDLAQLVLNTLESGMVEATSDSTITVGDVSIVSGVEYRYVTSESRYASAISDEEPVYSTSISTNGPIVELGEKLYDGDLTKDESDDNADAFGRPAVTWTYNNSEIGTYAEEADATYTAGVDKGVLYSLVGSTVYRDLSSSSDNSATFTVFVDGEGETEGVSQDLDDYIVRNEDDDAVGTGRGVLTQVYIDDDNNVTITMINTYVAQVTGDYDEDDEELELDTLDGVRFFTEIGGNVDLTLSSDDFDNLDRFSDGDYVLITVAEGEIQTIQAAEVIDATVTAYTVGSNVTADGTRYNYNHSFLNGRNRTTETANGYTETVSYSIDGDYALVLDEYGYVIYTDATDSVEDYVYIADMQRSSGVRSSLEADAYFTDGTNSVIVIYNDDDSENGVAVNANGWYTYSERSNGKYEVEKIADDEYFSVTSSTGAIMITESGSARVYYGTTTTQSYRANNNTIFVVNDGDNVTVYTGINEVPDIRLSSGSATVAAVMDGNYAEVVYINAENANISGSSDDRVYILDATPSVGRDSDRNTIYTYDAIVNGEIGEVVTSYRVTGGVGLYTDVSYDSDDYVDGMTKVTATNSDEADFYDYTETVVAVEYSNGVIAINGTDVDEDLVLAEDYNIFFNDDGDGERWTASKLNREFSDGFTGAIYVYLNDDDEVVDVYLAGAAAEMPEDETYSIELDQASLVGATAEITSGAEVDANGDVTVVITVTKTEGATFSGGITATPDQFGEAASSEPGESSPLTLEVSLTDVTADVTITVENGTAN